MESWGERDPATEANKAGSASEEFFEFQGHHHELEACLKSLNIWQITIGVLF